MGYHAAFYNFFGMIRQKKDSFMKSAYLVALTVAIFSLIACTEKQNPIALDTKVNETSTVNEIESEIQLKTDVEKFSYIVGGDVGLQFFQSQTNIDMDAFTLGMQDTLDNKRPKLSKKEAEKAVKKYYEQQQKKAAEFQEKATAIAEENFKEGKEFLVKNSKRDGVISNDSGLQYKIIIPGSGASPNSDSDVLVHYKGTYVDGREFDSSSQHDGAKAVKINLSQVIPGWTEALQLMKEGAKWEIYLPPRLAYGEAGSMPTIEPMTTLIFEVELEQVIAE
jgi:FKBP-type peptidyl-prolyl cis-trans isomerase